MGVRQRSWQPQVTDSGDTRNVSSVVAKLEVRRYRRTILIEAGSCRKIPKAQRTRLWYLEFQLHARKSGKLEIYGLFMFLLLFV